MLLAKSIIKQKTNNRNNDSSIFKLPHKFVSSFNHLFNKVLLERKFDYF